MAERERNTKLQELFDKGIPVYSYSKLCSWHGCKYNYYQAYILHNRSKDNIYNSIGTVVHDDLEKIYHNKQTLEQAKQNFNNTIKECECNGIKFPSNPPTTKINYIKNMNHFFDNYKILNTQMQTEQFVLYKIPKIENPKGDEDYIWIQMYVDSIMPIYENGEFKSVIINDWKTSSKFTKKELLDKGRQLIIYKLGVEQMTGVPVSKVGWTMLKYVYSCYKTKGNKANPPKTKKSLQQRKDGVKFLKKRLVDEYINMGYDTIEAELTVGKMVNNNDLSLLPNELKNKYWIEDCFLEYEFDDGILEECNNWIKNTVKEIESTEINISNFPPKQITDDNNYFCFNLCGRPDCIHLLKYKQENANKFKKEQKTKDIDNKLKNKISMDIDSLFKK
ncbi:hypothetical protein FDJ70_05690 [Clostridium botulinum]|nr:hypothetical protein [Clostridium botulinum]